MISIIHPSRNRSERSAATIHKWKERAGNVKVETILSVDCDDEQLSRYLIFGNCDQWVVYNNKNAIEAINRAALRSHGEILIVVSDDTDCPQNWAVDLLKEVGEKKDWILKTRDGIQPWLITMPVMDREYYNRFGYIYHPDYKHMWCDTELTCVAELTGRKIESKMLFPHNHYSVNKSVKDIVSRVADSTFESGKKIYIDRKRRLFDLPKEQIKAELPYNFYTTMQ